MSSSEEQAVLGFVSAGNAALIPAYRSHSSLLIDYSLLLTPHSSRLTVSACRIFPGRAPRKYRNGNLLTVPSREPLDIAQSVIGLDLAHQRYGSRNLITANHPKGWDAKLLAYI